MAETLSLAREWDKVFPRNPEVAHEKVTFPNRFGITLAADLYTLKDTATPLPALAVCGPFGGRLASRILRARCRAGCSLGAGVLRVRFADGTGCGE